MEVCTLCGDSLPSERETFGSHVAPYCSGCFHGYSETAQRMRIDGELARDYHRDEAKVDAYIASLTQQERAVQAWRDSGGKQRQDVDRTLVEASAESGVLAWGLSDNGRIVQTWEGKDAEGFWGLLWADYQEMGDYGKYKTLAEYRAWHESVGYRVVRVRIVPVEEQG